MKLPREFCQRMLDQLGYEGFQLYLAAMESAALRALRVNTLKTDVALITDAFSGAIVPDGVIPQGFLVPPSYHPSKDPLHMAGLIYMQEPSAQKPASLLSPAPNLRILDLCASPGGKSGQLAAMMDNTGLLISNEPVRSRTEVLAHNLERLGVRNALVTCMRPEALCGALPEFFDAVLVDAPCSGEGMFRKDAGAVANWSPKAVSSCALRQHAILSEAVKALRQGGRLVYSTCTFSKEENEDNIAAVLDSNPGFVLEKAERMYPHTSPGEGQFMALLRKGEGSSRASAHKPLSTESRPRAGMEPWRAFCGQYMTFIPKGARLLPDGRIVLMPEILPENVQALRIARGGVLAGEIRGGLFIPDHALYMAYPSGAFTQTLELNPASLKTFVSGQTLPCPGGLSGWCAVCWKGFPLGFGKAVQGTLKNHLPKGLRLCM